MEVLQRAQALDILFAVVWAAIVGWGLQAGLVRMLGMLIGVYGATLLAGSIYRQTGQALALAFGRGILPQLEFAAYVGVFVIAFGLLALLIWRAYPSSRFGREFGAENIFGGVVGAIWGVLFLIELLTILRYFTALQWPEQEATQLAIRTQVHLAQVPPVLQLVAAPLWDIMAPWFPTQVGRNL